MCCPPGKDTGVGDPMGCRRPYLVLGGILLLGMALRLYRLEAQSIWADEYFLTVFFGAPNTRTFLGLARFWSPDVMPLGYTFLYWWGNLFAPGSFVAWRLAPVAVSLICIPLIWLLGREAHSNRAGLVAAMLLALSPVHIWVGQSIRPNALLELYALVSLYALLRGLRTGNIRWWVLHLSANILLVWTHIFMVFLIAAEGTLLLLLLILERRHTVLWWSSVMLGVLFPSFLWLKESLANVSTAEDDFIMQIPPFLNLIADWIADDAVRYSEPFLFQGETWPFLTGRFREAFVANHAYFDAALFAFFGTCLLFGVWASISSSISMRKDEQGRTRRAIPAMPLFVSVTILPLAFMLLASLVWRPCIQPRYTSYCSLAMYVVAGTALASLGWRRLRAAILALLFLVYAYQLSFLLPAATRTDWLGADRYIGESARPGDVVLVKGTCIAWESYEFNARSTHVPVLPAYSLEAICDKAGRYLSTAEAGANPTVWAVIEPFIYTIPPLSSFEDVLRSMGLTFLRRDFPGMNGLFAYAIRTGADGSLAPRTMEIPSRASLEAVLTDMGLAQTGQEGAETAEHVLRSMIDTEWPLTPFSYSMLSFSLSGEGCPYLASVAARRAIELNPDVPLGHFALAVALGEQGDAAGAMEALSGAKRVDRNDIYEYYTDLMLALYGSDDTATARREYDRLNRLGLFLPQALRVRTGLQPPELYERVRLFPGQCPEGQNARKNAPM